MYFSVFLGTGWCIHVVSLLICTLLVLYVKLHGVMRCFTIDETHKSYQRTTNRCTGGLQTSVRWHCGLETLIWEFWFNAALEISLCCAVIIMGRVKPQKLFLFCFTLLTSYELHCAVLSWTSITCYYESTPRSSCVWLHSPP